MVILPYFYGNIEHFLSEFEQNLARKNLQISESL